MNPVRLAMVILLCASILVLPAFAEEPAPVTYDREVVVTAERSPDAFAESARAVSIVSGEDIYQRVLRTVPESLRYEEGIMVQRTNQGGGAPFIRGLVGNQVLYMVDGIRVNNSTFRGGPNQYLNTIDPFFIDRVEIVRGPSSVLYGSDALGGAINVITKRRKDFSDPWDIDGRLMGRASSAELEQTGHLDFDMNAGKVFGTALSGNFRSFGDIDAGSNIPDQAPYGYEEQDFAGNFDFYAGSHVIFEFAAQHVNLDDVPNYDPGNIKNNFEPQRRQLFYMKMHVNDLSDYLDRITLFGSYHIQTEGRERITADDSDVEQRDLDQVNTIGAGLQLESPIGRWVRFIYGGETYYDSIASEREIGSIATGDATDADPQFPDGSTYLNAGTYLEARVTPTEWMKQVVGVRYSHFQPDIEMDDPNLGKVTVDDPIQDVTWSAHMLFRFVDYHGIVLGASRGFRAPGIDDLTKLGSEDGRYDIPNSELDPESMIQYELGYRATHPNYFFSLFGYYSSIADLIVRKPTSYKGQTIIGQDQVHQNDNVGEAFIYGAEMSGKFIFLDEFFTLGGTATYTLGQNETDEEPLRRIPPLMGTVFARVTFEPVWFQWDMEAAGNQDRLSQGDKDDARIGPEGTPGFDIHHIRFGADVTDWCEIITAVENVSDEKYKYHGSGIYEPGRNYKMQVSFLF